jgi:hypothetical protein
MIHNPQRQRHRRLMIPVMFALTAASPVTVEAHEAAACATAPTAPATPKKKFGLGGLLKAVRDAGATDLLPAGSTSRATRVAEGAVAVASGGDPAGAVAGATGSDQAGRAAGVVTNLARQAGHGC